MIQKSQPWATGDWQLPHDNMLAHASCLMQGFFGETSNHPGESTPAIAQIWRPATYGFSQN